MQDAGAEVVAIVLLALCLYAAVVRPFGITEGLVAVPAAGLVVGLGIVSVHDAGQTLREIGPTVGFLAAILVFGHLCAEAGVFDYLGQRAATASRGDPRRLLVQVVGLAALITATLTLDATVVLLTPVVLATTRELRLRASPHTYACARLANSGSLLLPVSNLTNLLAYSASGLSFGRFAGLMALPWLLACGGEWLTLRVVYRRDLSARESSTPATLATSARAPAYALVVLAVTVALFVATSAVHLAPAWAALAGCVALLVPRIARPGSRRDVRVRTLVSQASPGFCLFVLGLAIVVDGVAQHGLARVLTTIVPAGDSLPALLALAGIAALLANLLNNLPATLALVPIVGAHPASVLAMLIGVNIGPNATYPGSLATLLWRRQLPAADRPSARQFHRLGLLTVPALLVIAAVALWAGGQVLGF